MEEHMHLVFTHSYTKPDTNKPAGLSLNFNSPLPNYLKFIIIFSERKYYIQVLETCDEKIYN